MKNILLVDSDSEVLETLEKRLHSSMKNVNILKASTYKDAIKYILDKKSVIDAAIVDLYLPDVNHGAVALFTLKKNIPTVVLTELDDEKTHTLIENNDFVDYLNKKDINSCTNSVQDIVGLFRNRNINVLVVDDSPLQLAYIVKMLHHLKLNVTTARDGQEALDIVDAQEQKFSIVITDYNMPRMDGMELTVALRKRFSKDLLSIIVLSINDSQEIPSKFLQLGANDFLKKPFSELDVSIRINTNLEVLELFEKVRDMANRDYLTGAFNRRYFFDAAEAIFKKSQRKQESVAVAMVDIDKFKNINDTYGHDVGDLAIVKTTEIINSTLRSSDLMARFGGEEFCILLEEISQEDAQALFEKIRERFEENVLVDTKQEIRFTVSIGVSYGLEESLEEMIKIADNGLYYCKENGRNQVAFNIK